jgi:hypothetical protein
MALKVATVGVTPQMEGVMLDRGLKLPVKGAVPELRAAPASVKTVLTKLAPASAADGAVRFIMLPSGPLR